MSRQFVVEAESIASRANFLNATIVLEALRRSGARVRKMPGPFGVRNRFGVLGKDMFRVHQQQLLMLLFVVQAEFNCVVTGRANRVFEQ